MDISQKKTTKVISKCSFKDSIDRVYEVLTDGYIFTDIMKEYLGEIHFLKGNNLGVLGTEFTFYLEKQYLVHIAVTNVITNENYRKIVTKPMKSAIVLDFEISHCLYWDSIEETTLYVKELIVRDSEVPITSEGIDKYKVEQIDISKRMKNWLKNTTIGLEQEESINLKTSARNAWELVSNFQLFARHVPLFANRVDIIGDKRVRIINSYKDCEYYITKWSVNDLLNEFVLESCEGFEPSHLLKFTVIHIAEGYCFISIKHKFIQGIPFKNVNKIIELKKRLLLDVKKLLEKSIL